MIVVAVYRKDECAKEYRITDTLGKYVVRCALFFASGHGCFFRWGVAVNVAVAVVVPVVRQGFLCDGEACDVHCGQHRVGRQDH